MQPLKLQTVSKLCLNTEKNFQKISNTEMWFQYSYASNGEKKKTSYQKFLKSSKVSNMHFYIWRIKIVIFFIFLMQMLRRFENKKSPQNSISSKIRQQKSLSLALHVICKI